MMPFSCYQFSERTRTVQYRTASTETTLNKLENRCTLAGTVGSNPTLSASYQWVSVLQRTQNINLNRAKL